MIRQGTTHINIGLARWRMAISMDAVAGRREEGEGPLGKHQQRADVEQDDRICLMRANR